MGENLIGNLIVGETFSLVTFLTDVHHAEWVSNDSDSTCV